MKPERFYIKIYHRLIIRRIIMEKIIEILNGLKSGVDFANEKSIVTGKILGSVEITTLIATLEDEFDIEIGMEYMENSNFDSVDAIWEMVQELQEA